MPSLHVTEPTSLSPAAPSSNQRQPAAELAVHQQPPVLAGAAAGLTSKTAGRNSPSTACWQRSCSSPIGCVCVQPEALPWACAAGPACALLGRGLGDGRHDQAVHPNLAVIHLQAMCVRLARWQSCHALQATSKSLGLILQYEACSQAANGSKITLKGWQHLLCHPQQSLLTVTVLPHPVTPDSLPSVVRGMAMLDTHHLPCFACC